MVADGRARPGRAAALTALAFVMMTASGASTALAEPRDALATKILLRALSFDRALDDRAGAEVAIVILFDPDDQASRDDRAVMEQTLRAMARRKIAGRRLTVKVADCTNVSSVDGALRGAAAAYVTAGTVAYLPTIVAMSRKYRVSTLTRERDYVERGVAIGVDFERGRPRLVVNLPASKKEGMALSAQMLRLAEVLR